MTTVDVSSAVVREALLEATAPQPVETLSVDTTDGSPLHQWVRRGGRRESALRIYLWSAVGTYLPLAIAALLGPLPVLQIAEPLRLTFFRDWNVMVMLLISFPSMVYLLATDQTVLADALRRVQRDGVIEISTAEASRLINVWKRRWRPVNRFGYAAGIVQGVVVAVVNFRVYADPDVGYWIASNSRLVLPGYLFLACVFLFYAVIPIYVVRCVAISLFFRDAVSNARLHMLPFHPDKCGGLRPVGRLGLRTQAVLTILGFNLLSLTAISAMYLRMPDTLKWLAIAGAIAYVIVGPIVFVAPLLPFRNGMIRTKSELMAEVSERLRIELYRLRQQLPAGDITKGDEELIDRLRKIGGVIDQLPVWPFDTGTLRSFVSAYVFPIIGAGLYPALKAVVSALGLRL